MVSGLGVRVWFFQLEGARPVDDLVAALAGFGVVDHGLIHAVEVDRGHAPDDRLDGAALNGALGEITGESAFVRDPG